MKSSIDHLPQLKQNELNQIIPVIRRICDDVELIVLFGSYARGDWKEETDLEPGRKSGHKSDYDILVVTREKETSDNIELWSEITKACNDLKQSTHARIISHDIGYLNIQLARGQYFFSDIKKEGCILYDSGKIELVEERKLTPAEQSRIARDYYENWFSSAKSFFKAFTLLFNEKEYKIAAFQLHQATEATYKTFLLVFTNYNPNEHYLSLLHAMAVDEDGRFEGIFPKTSHEEQERFRKLDYAYIGARYEPEFRITKEDLEILATHVKELLELTERVCKKKIQNLTE